MTAASNQLADGGLDAAKASGITVGNPGDRMESATDLHQVWSINLNAGDVGAYHLHRHPWVLVVVSGTELVIERIDGTRQTLPIAPGKTLSFDAPGQVQRFINAGDSAFSARIVSLKSERFVFAGDLPPADPKAAGGGEAAAAAFREILIRTNERDWEPKSLPGLSQKMLWRDEESGASIALIRFEKGAGIPNAHAHASNQFMYCLSGQYRYVPTGTTLVPGSFYCNPEGSVHGPTVADETTVFVEIYDGPHYPVQPPWYTNEDDAR